MSFIAPMPDSTDLSQRLLAQLRFPCSDVPEPGDIKNVAPGIWWLRMPLPFQLNHINLWLVEEKDGWTIVDTGINTEATRELWDKIFAEKLGGKPVTRVIATHLHPDHVGLAGWLCERWDAPLYMTLGEYMSAVAARNDIVENEDVRAAHLARNGVPAEKVPLFHRHKGGYAKGVAPLPPAYRRLIHAHPVTIGGHRWDVIVGRGHAPEHASLWCPELNVLIAGDLEAARQLATLDLGFAPIRSEQVHALAKINPPLPGHVAVSYHRLPPHIVGDPSLVEKARVVWASSEDELAEL